MNAAAMGLLIAFIATGYSLLYGVLRVVNFAHTDVIAIAGYACIVVASFLGRQLSFAEAALVSSIMGVLFGVACSTLIYAPFKRKTLDGLLASFCVSLAIRGGLALSFGSFSRPMPVKSDDIWLWFGLTAVAGSVALGWILSRTLYGLALRASGSDSEQVALLGYRTKWVALGAFLIAGILGSLTAIPVGIENGIAPDIGNMYGLWAFAATILGGFGRLRGTWVAGLILGAGLTVAARFLSPLFVNAFVFGVMAIVIAVQPQGLSGILVRRV